MIQSRSTMHRLRGGRGLISRQSPVPCLCRGSADSVTVEIPHAAMQSTGSGGRVGPPLSIAGVRVGGCELVDYVDENSSLVDRHLLVCRDFEAGTCAGFSQRV